ncbi:SUN domain-containing protein 4 [Zea mays]|uniref:Galactose-binding protein n=1 Tax=Zea mays TaxID=4577 RepID=A0A1D6N5R4_MAIZE|nr:SUN domain-containing protein 4 [Zea mays]ONM35962.1 Galactose-binding protein [Zea mays]|eukprot:XP_008674756.1 SUN domain-containing protein 4 [Zea mays]
MQRSRRALLRRTAAAQEQSAVAEAAANGRRRRLYGFSASLVVASWVAVLLLHSLVGHGDGQRDGGGSTVDLTVVEPTVNVGPINPVVQEEHGGDLEMPGDSCVNSDENAVLSEDTLVQADQLCSSDEVQNENTEAVTIDSQVELSGDQGGYLPQSGVDSGVQPGEKVESKDLPRPPRLSRVAPPDLDEFKTRAIAERGPGISSQPGNIIHRREPSGKLYNYAAASKGAKVLDFNKEAKGASNILDKDKDKYLRNPCSAEGKFVIIELSEETLVDTIAIANFEHYSSNPKEFELLSSLTYPTENWETLGRFTAANAKLAQNFTFLEPKWARYLKLNLVSHYGSEFYCTLSVLEVYGMDAVEKMLENLIPVENKKTEPDDKTKEPIEKIYLKDPAGGKEFSQETLDEDEFELEDDKPNGDSLKNGANDPVSEARTLQAGRIPGDTVLKVLMQKVQSLDVSFSVLERYLVELNSRYGQIFKDFDADIDSKDVLLEKIQSELKNLESSKDNIMNEVDGFLSWKLVASSQLNQLVLDNALLRLEFEIFRQKQTDMENRSLAVIFLSFVFACLALAKLSIGIMSRFCRFYNFEKFHNVRSGWLVLLLSSCVISTILIIQ